MISDDSNHEVAGEQSPDHLSGVTGLFSCVFATCILIIAIVFFLRGNTGAYNLAINSTSLVLRAKQWDHLMFALAVIAAIGLTVAFVARRTKENRWTIAAALVATAGLVVGIFSVEEPLLEKTFYLWSGFGLSGLIFVIALAPFVWRIFEWRSLHHRIRIAISVILGVICVSDMMVLYRPAYALIDPYNDRYILNEMLAPAAGKAPDAQFVPLYDALYGWLLKPFASHVSVGDLTEAACIMLSVFSIGAVLFAVLMAYRVLGRTSLALAAALIVPLACVEVAHSPLATVAAEYQDYPIRVFPVMLLAAFGIEEIVKIRKGHVRPIRTVAIGFLAGLVAWNNHDFGVTGVLVLALLFIVSSSRRFSGPRPTLLFFLGSAVGVLAYPVALAIGGTPISLAFIFHFQFTFANGFLAYPVQIPGPVLIVMPLIVATAAVGWYSIWTRSRSERVRDELDVFDERASVTATFFGTWMLLSFAYYLNRSIAAGQLQVYFPACGVAIASLIALVSGQVSESRSSTAQREQRKPLLSRPRVPITWIGLIPITLLAALPFSAILDSPNPIDTVKTLQSPPSSARFTWPSVFGIEIESEIARSHGESVAYYGEWGNYVQLATGVQSVALVDDPPIGVAAPGSIECQYVNGAEEDVLIVDTTTAQAFGTGEICGDYRVTTDNAASPYLIYQRS